MNNKSLRCLLLSTVCCLLNIQSAWSDEIVIFGASGTVGKSIVKEALSRGHSVIGVSRQPEQFTYTEDNFRGVKGNPTDVNSVLELTEGVDAIISAVGGRTATEPEQTAMNLSARAFTQALGAQAQKGPRLVVIGGGLTMQGSRQKMLDNLPSYAVPGSAMYALFMGHWSAYETYAASNINWTFIAPPLNIKGLREGEDVRTGKFRASTDGYVVDAQGNNSLSLSDLAVAAVDFAEGQQFNQVRVAVGE